MSTVSGPKGVPSPAQTPMPELVARQIEAMILDGRLRAGERLPAERSLCDSLNVSRNTLREALKELRARGVIITRRGSGTFVASFQELQPDIQALHPETPLRKLLQNHPETLEGLLEVRRLLEGEAAYQAARRARPEDLEELQQAYEALVDENPKTNTSQAHAERDLRFHRAFYAAAHNPILLLALNSIRDLLMSFFFDTSGKLYSLSLQKRQLRTQHRRIFRAIETGDAAGARRAATAHIDAVAQSLKEFKKKQ